MFSPEPSVNAQQRDDEVPNDVYDGPAWVPWVTIGIIVVIVVVALYFIFKAHLPHVHITPSSPPKPRVE